MAAMAAELENPGAGDGPGAWGPVLAPSQGDDPALSTWLEEAGRAGPATAQAYFSLMQGTDARELLPSISAPTLIFHNTGDPFVPVGAARYMADAIPNSRLLEHDSPDNVFFTTDLDEKIGELEAFLVTERRNPAQRRLLTVLFTDVVGSTERLSASRDVRWSATLDEIDSTVHRHARSHGGRVCKSMGDGHLAVFERPSDAVAAGLAIARAVSLLGIDIRAGAHVGEVELRGDDVAGVAVHIGARVSAHAGPGELLVTRTVADLLEGSGHHTELVGDVALKGLPDTWSLYRVR
jgi:class 3 adenylate cyclase